MARRMRQGASASAWCARLSKPFPRKAWGGSATTTVQRPVSALIRLSILTDGSETETVKTHDPPLPHCGPPAGCIHVSLDHCLRTKPIRWSSP